jgi:D-glycero-alpha-D-manno-heptose-7-phosphate kinase
VEALLAPLRLAARRAAAALEAGDLAAYGAALVLNCDAQAALDAELVSDDAAAVIEVARRHGALGWKVNGAGGDGGSVTILSGPDRTQKRAMIQAIETENPKYRSIPIYLSRFGLRRWESHLNERKSD